MTTEPTAPASVPEEYNSGHGITVFEAGNEVGIHLWYEGIEILTPDQADALADALKAHAAAARKAGSDV